MSVKWVPGVNHLFILEKMDHAVKCMDYTWVTGLSAKQIFPPLIASCSCVEPGLKNVLMIPD